MSGIRSNLAVFGVACCSCLVLTGSAFALSSGPEAGFDAGSGSAQLAKGAGNFIPDQVVVQYRSAADATDKSQARQSVDATVADHSEYKQGLQLLSLNGNDSVQEAVSELESDEAVKFAEPNFVRELTAVPSDTNFPCMWSLHNIGEFVSGCLFAGGTRDADIDAPEAWDTETGSRDVTVAVIDTGIDFQHPDLSNNIWTNPGEVGNDQYSADKRSNGVDDDGNGYKDDWRGWDFGANDNDPTAEYYPDLGGDTGSHGVYVAGTIGAEGNDGYGVTGVAWKVSLMGVRLYASGMTTWKAEEAFRYAGANGADVANGSIISPVYSEAERSALEQSPDTLFVFAAGNEGQDNDQTPGYPCNYAVANVICVAATDNNDSLASFSNFGESSVDLAAPGVDILSTRASYQGGGWGYLSGTSIASPVVTGAAAVLLAHRPDASVADLRAALLGGVDQKQSLQQKVASGGRLNLDKALDLVDGGGAPANDAFADAFDVAGAELTRSDDTNVGATREAGEPEHAGNEGGASIWYRWTAPASGTVTIDTLGSDFDTTLAAYTGSAVNDLSAVASNDNVDSGVRQSKISFKAISGMSYRVAVDGHNYGYGNGATTDKVDLHLALRDVTHPEASIDRLSVKGPAKVRKSKKVTYKVEISNSGKVAATGVRLQVNGNGVKAKKAVGKIAERKVRTVKLKLKFNKPGKVKLTFKVTSSNARGKRVKKTVTVKE